MVSNAMRAYAQSENVVIPNMISKSYPKLSCANRLVNLQISNKGLKKKKKKRVKPRRRQ